MPVFIIDNVYLIILKRTFYFVEILQITVIEFLYNYRICNNLLRFFNLIKLLFFLKKLNTFKGLLWSTCSRPESSSKNVILVHNVHVIFGLCYHAHNISYFIQSFLYCLWIHQSFSTYLIYHFSYNLFFWIFLIELSRSCGEY